MSLLRTLELIKPAIRRSFFGETERRLFLLPISPKERTPDRRLGQISKTLGKLS